MGSLQRMIEERADKLKQEFKIRGALWLSYFSDEVQDIIEAAKEEQDDEPIKLNTHQWCKIFDIEMGTDILDPDGWDRSKLDEELDKKITRKEFERAISRCTCRLHGIREGMRIGNLIISGGKK